MDDGDGATATSNPARPDGRPRPPAGARRWSREPHHRRRRAVAALVGAIVLLVVSVSVIAELSGGSGAAHRPALRPGGFLGRLRTLGGTGPGSFAASEAVSESRAIDRTLAYTPYVRVAGAQHRELALTFDDGPGPYTPAILTILERENVPATFFEVGFEEQWFHASTSAIVAQGDAIGDHTFTHPPMSGLPAAQQSAQLLEQAGAIARYGAPFPRLFRPPYGVWNATTLRLLRRYRMLMVLWTVDTNDYRRPGVRAIVDAAVSGARPGAIILLHDAGGDRSQTIAALPKIIAALRRRGYGFATVPRLLLDNPPPANQQFAAPLGQGG